MLVHSPRLPLTVDYRSEYGITAEDEKGLLLALKQHDRLRHLRLVFPARILRKLVMAIDEEFPILEYLIVDPPMRDSTALMLPETLQAPNLRHLKLRGFTYPVRPRLHPTAVGLVTLYLTINHLSAYFQPNFLLQWVSFMSQLEILVIAFSFIIPNRDVERHLRHTGIQQPRHPLHFLTFAYSGSEALALTWKRLFVGSRLLDSKSCKFDSLSNSTIPFHALESSSTRQIASGSTMPRSCSRTSTLTW